MKRETISEEPSFWIDARIGAELPETGTYRGVMRGRAILIFALGLFGCDGSMQDKDVEPATMREPKAESQAILRWDWPLGRGPSRNLAEDQAACRKQLDDMGVERSLAKFKRQVECMAAKGWTLRK